MTVGEICSRSVVITTPGATVREAAELMRRHHVGDLVVVDRQDDGTVEPVGIVTDRDLVIEVMAVGADDARAVGGVMTAELITAQESEDPASVLKRMRGFGVRRMPIVDADGALLGIITYDDLIEWLTEQLGDLIGIVRAEERHERARL